MTSGNFTREKDPEFQFQELTADQIEAAGPVHDSLPPIEYAALYMHDYSNEPRLRDLPLRLVNTPRLVLLALIRLYQTTLSRALPANSCRFYPSCSHYGYQAIYKYGALRGSLMAAWRILRCNPFNRGGYDPVR